MFLLRCPSFTVSTFELRFETFKAWGGTSPNFAVNAPTGAQRRCFWAEIRCIGWSRHYRCLEIGEISLRSRRQPRQLLQLKLKESTVHREPLPPSSQKKLIFGPTTIKLWSTAINFQLSIVLAPTHFQWHMANLDIVGYWIYWILATWPRDGPVRSYCCTKCVKSCGGVGVLGDILSKTGQGILQKWSDPLWKPAGKAWRRIPACGGSEIFWRDVED